jgi:RHS repeat-associated protein
VQVSDRKYIWSGTTMAEERDSTGGTVTKRFFAEGEQIGGANYYFTRDHLGSVREMTNSSGQIVNRYDYDPFGHSPYSGPVTVEADFGFTGHWFHGEQAPLLDPVYRAGRYLTMYRGYDPSVGRWMSRDPIRESGGLNLYGYVGNNPMNLWDPLGLSGWITIYSSGNGGSSMTSGHSWISYTPDGAHTTTYGTWGNNPTGNGNGLFENLEAGRTSDAARSMYLDDNAEEALLDKIQLYRNMGQNAWKYGSPCSEFARDAWKTATSESLNSNWGPLNNPTTLKYSIISANGGVNYNTATRPNGGNSASSGSFGRSSGSSLNSLGSFFP